MCGLVAKDAFEGAQQFQQSGHVSAPHPRQEIRDPRRVRRRHAVECAFSCCSQAHLLRTLVLGSGAALDQAFESALPVIELNTANDDTDPWFLADYSYGVMARGQRPRELFEIVLDRR